MQSYPGIWWKEAIERSTVLDKSSHYSISIYGATGYESDNYIGKNRSAVVVDSEFMN